MGVLDGVKVIEVAGIGPGPFAAMMLADMGADVLRVDRPRRGPRDSRSATRARTCWRAAAARWRWTSSRPRASRCCSTSSRAPTSLLEGYRPGVAERLGFGPDECHARNERLVYGRMTGWGQEGPNAARAGHDLTYLSTAGVVAHIEGPDGAPGLPINLVGDFGGGGMLLVFGVARGTGRAGDVGARAGRRRRDRRRRGRCRWRWSTGCGRVGCGRTAGPEPPRRRRTVLRALPLRRRRVDRGRRDRAAVLRRAHEAPGPRGRGRRHAPVGHGPLAGVPCADRGGVRDPDARRVGGGPGADRRRRRRRAGPRRGARAPPQPGARAVRRRVRCRASPRRRPVSAARPSATPSAPAAPGQHSAEALADWGIAPDRVAKLQEAGVVHQA